MRTTKFWMLGIFGCIYAAFLVFRIIAFMAVWYGGDWLFYWATFLGGGQLGIGLARIALWQDGRTNLFAPVAALRQAIRDGDGTIAPVAETFRELASDGSAGPGRLGPLRRPEATVSVVVLWGVALLVLLVLWVGVPLALGAGNGYLALLLASVGLPPALVCILLGWRHISPLFVRIDLDGLRWRRPLGLTVRVAWRDVTRLFSLTYVEPFAHERETLYVLDGGPVALIWRADADTKAGAAPPSPAQRLPQFITEYTGLPLRDVTIQAERIARGASRLVSAPHLPKEDVRHRFRVLEITLSPLLVLALVSLIAMLVQVPYYDHLLVQAHAHEALYRDPLTHADSDWPDTSFAHFDQGVYHFQQSDSQTYMTYVMAPHRYDHALVEVSGRTGGTFNLGGVGLAIAGPSLSTPLLTFRVAPDGSWWVERLPTTGTNQSDNSTRLGNLSAIHPGFGTYNQIAVLLNGGDFAFYVNGQYATGYHDNALTDGEVGLYLDITSDSGDFSNFAVYPV